MVTKDTIQKATVEAWVNKGKKATAELTTGTGKTITALHALYTMPKNDGKVHLFLAETNAREKDLMSDILLYNKLFNVNVLNDYNLKFYCYQTVWKWEGVSLGLVIADEIHNSLSSEYFKFYENNNYDALIGLSATIDSTTPVEFRGELLTKLELLNRIAPVCYTYTIADAKRDNIGRDLDIYIIRHELDAVNKTIRAGNAKKVFAQTEKAAYQYWDNQFKKAMFIFDEDKRESMMKIISSKRSKILYDLPSKIAPTKALLTEVKGKSIVFSNSLDFLQNVTFNVISSKHSKDHNDRVRRMFDADQIAIIGSFKKLRQGANLKNIDNCVVTSYYSSETHIVQQMGRLRKNGDKVGSVFIFVTVETQEEIWISKMLANITENFKIISCDNVQDCLTKYRNRNGY